MALVGSVESFDINCDNWLEYVERVKQYFVANAIDTKARENGVQLSEAKLTIYLEIWFYPRNQLICPSMNL